MAVVMALRSQFQCISLFIVFLLILLPGCESCQSCFYPKILHHRRHHHHQHHALSSSVTASAQVFRPYGNIRTKPVVVAAARRFLKLCKSHQTACLALTTVAGGTAMIINQHLTTRQKLRVGNVWKNENENENGHEKVENEHSTEESEPSSPDVSSTAMIATIGIYKNFISPLLPPACRFVPTCSQYGVQAIKEYGSCKGVVLTSWRLLRCSPFGGKGYDPPKVS
jgi:putative membrane protein insertion efficiency factor